MTSNEVSDRSGDQAPTIVYAMTRGSSNISEATQWLLALVCGIIGPVIVIAGLLRISSGGVGGVVVGLLVTGFGLLSCAAAVNSLQVIRNLHRLRRHQDPYFLVDVDGIECALGRLRWADVTRVVEVSDPYGDTGSVASLILIVRPGANPEATAATYLEGYDRYEIGAAKLTGYGLELSVPNCRKRARAAIQYAHDTPVQKVDRDDLRTDATAVR